MIIKTLITSVMLGIRTIIISIMIIAVKLMTATIIAITLMV